MDVFDRLDFTNNCTLASYYIANWFYLEPGINITVEYIYSALNPADGATFLEVLSWFLSVTNGGDVYSFESKWFHRAIELPYERCQVEVCRSVIRNGNPDMAGIGACCPSLPGRTL